MSLHYLYTMLLHYTVHLPPYCLIISVCDGGSKPPPYDLFGYDAFAMGICAAFSIFSMKIPYPAVGSFIKTWVTAPTSLPFWMMGEPDTSVVK